LMKFSGVLFFGVPIIVKVNSLMETLS